MHKLKYKHTTRLVAWYWSRHKHPYLSVQSKAKSGTFNLFLSSKRFNFYFGCFFVRFVKVKPMLYVMELLPTITDHLAPPKMPENLLSDLVPEKVYFGQGLNHFLAISFVYWTVFQVDLRLWESLILTMSLGSISLLNAYMHLGIGIGQWLFILEGKKK